MKHPTMFLIAASLLLSIGLCHQEIVSAKVETAATHVHVKTTLSHGAARNAAAKLNEPIRSLRGQPAIDYLKQHGLFKKVHAAVKASGHEMHGSSVANAAAPLAIDPLFTEAKKLSGSDGMAGDQFGFSVATSGDTVIVGAWQNDGNAGAAYLFERNHGGTDSWGEVKKLTASDGAEEDRFGWAVALSGDTAIVGAFANNGNKGAAYVFQQNHGGADSWGEVKKLTASDGAANDVFGFSVALSGDLTIIGAYGVESFKGAAYVFGRNQGGTDLWGQVKKLTGSDVVPDDVFGSSVALSGDTAVVGAYFHASAVGAAYVFQQNLGGANGWGEVKKLTASDGALNDNFGFSLALSGDTAVVGAVGAVSNMGAAYVYERNQGGVDVWGEVKKLNASDGLANDQFGDSVTISLDTVVVAAYGDDDNKGAAYVFGRNQGGAELWGEVNKLTASDGVAADFFGFSVALSGDTTIVGAVGVDGDKGASYLFTRQSNTPPTVTNVTSSTPNGLYSAGATISVQVSFSKTVTVTGAPQLALNSGGIANYGSGSGTDTLTLSYKVASGQSSADLDYISVSALSLNGGAIVDALGNNASAALPAPGVAGSLGANKSIVIAAAAPTPTPTPTPSPSPTPPGNSCTAAGVLDNFNRANGGLGNNWRGFTDTDFYRIRSNRLDVQAGGPTYWNAASFGTNQSAFITFTALDSHSPSQGLLLKVQTGSVPQRGAIAVVYDSFARAVRVWTFHPDRRRWRLYGNTRVRFANGDKLTACVKANGVVRIFKNNVLIATVTLNAADQSFFNGKGGKVGLWTFGARNASFDDFGGGTGTP
jgi:hypothetical protein